MVSYNACCYPGCYNRIPYEKGEIPEKYCQNHAAYKSRSNLVTTEPIKKFEAYVIMKCPSCKARTSILKSEWMLKPTIPCTSCAGVMIYHKDGTEPKTLHEKASIQDDGIGWN